MVAVEHDHPRAGAEDGLAAGDEVDQRLGESLSLDSEPDGRGFASRDDESIDALEILGRADLPDVDVEAGECLRMGLEPALKGEDADHQPRFWSSPPLS
jgi:hypothetical protein